MTIRAHPGRWLILAALSLVVIGTFLLLNRPSWIFYYRVDGDQTLVVGTLSAEGAWTRVTNVTETDASVTITVSSFLFRLGFDPADAVPIESTVTLARPIGERVVIDGSSGLAVRRTSCLPPAYFAPGCG